VNEATAEFRALAERCIDQALEADPVEATWMGDHRFDDRLPELGPTALDERARTIDDQLTAIDAIDDVELDVPDLVDLEILRARLQREAFGIEELRSTEWNPMVWNPGTALHLLLSRDFAPLDERLASAAGRLSQIPEFLGAGARLTGFDARRARGNGDRAVPGDPHADRRNPPAGGYGGWCARSRGNRPRRRGNR